MAEKAKVRAITQEPKQKCSNSCKQDTSYSSSGAPADRIMQFQKTAGNQAVQRLIKSGTLQAKLRVGQPDDVYEKEAERVAEQVIRMPTSPSAAIGQATVQRQTLRRDKVTQIKPLASTITPLVQKAPSNSLKSFEPGANFESKLNISSGGIPLPAGTRAFMEPRFGADFSGVRLHMDSQAKQLNRSISAQAFTLGQDIFLGEGWNDLESNTGKRLLAHELTHTIQQNSGQVTGLQRTVDEGHDLKSPRFAGDKVLEACYDGKHRITVYQEGGYVGKIQQALVDLGFPLPKFGVDSKYGPETARAVAEFKRVNNIKPSDGVVGPKTMDALDKKFTEIPGKTADVPSNTDIKTDKPGKLTEKGKVEKKPEVKPKPVSNQAIPVADVKKEDEDRLFSITYNFSLNNPWELRLQPFSLCTTGTFSLGGKINIGLLSNKSHTLFALNEPEITINTIPVFCGDNPGVTAQINLLKGKILGELLEADLVGILGLPDKFATNIPQWPFTGGWQAQLQWMPFGEKDTSLKKMKVFMSGNIIYSQGVEGKAPEWSVSGTIGIGHEFDFGPKLEPKKE